MVAFLMKIFYFFLLLVIKIVFKLNFTSMLVYPHVICILFSTSDPQHLIVCHIIGLLSPGQLEPNQEKLLVFGQIGRRTKHASNFYQSFFVRKMWTMENNLLICTHKNMSLIMGY